VAKHHWYDYFKSWLFWVNFLFFQWFFVRLEETVDIRDGKEIHLMWGLLRYPVPLTGWWTDYRFWPKRVQFITPRRMRPTD
jgi:hypothetical protein